MSELNARYISKARRAVCERFPEMIGAEPTLAVRKAGAKNGESAGAPYVLTFRKGVALPDGGRLTRVVRVTLNQAGEIVKIASSK